MKDALDKYIEAKRNARKEFWLNVGFIVAVLGGAFYTLGRLQ